jgi:hypothetical protein
VTSASQQYYVKLSPKLLSLAESDNYAFSLRTATSQNWTKTGCKLSSPCNVSSPILQILSTGKDFGYLPYKCASDSMATGSRIDIKLKVINHQYQFRNSGITSQVTLADVASTNREVVKSRNHRRVTMKQLQLDKLNSQVIH